MSAIEKREDAKAVIWYDSSVITRMHKDLFDPDWLRENGFYQGHSAGRSQAHFLRLDGVDMVLRHYCRGGVIGRFNKDLFLRAPVDRSRAMREFQLLRWMRGQGLPVPLPLAARFVPMGLWYRADLIMERIPDARPLADWLLEAALSTQDWTRIGATIGRMHELGVDHTDLNCRNILLDAQRQVWLIDFDKCRRRAAGGWRQGNLARLRRSLEKESARQPGLLWSEADWAALAAGYGATPA